MKKLLLLIFPLLIISNAFAFISPSIHSTADNSGNKTVIEKILSLTPKQFEQLTGKHLTLKEKIAVKLLKWKFKKQEKRNFAEGDGKYEKMARASMIFGIASLICLFIPYAVFISIPAAILAIVLGSVSIKKAGKTTNSILGIVFGSVTLALILLAFIIVAALFAGI